MKTILRILKILFGALFLVFVGHVVLNGVFYRRLVTYPRQKEIVAMDWYQPVEVVAGASDVPRQWETPPTTSVEMNPAALKQARSYAQQNQSGAFLVIKNGKLIVEDYGAGFSRDAFFNSMSMAKTLLALALGVAIDEGKIQSINQPVGAYLKSWQQSPQAADLMKIRIKDLLQMASGLRFHDDAGNPFSDLARMHLGPDLRPFIDEAQVEKGPGLEFKYSNLNAQIIVAILEAATGQRYASYLSEKIWKPIEASDAKVWLDHPGGMAKGYCCFLARPLDWARVGLLLLNRGRWAGRQVVSARWIEQMLQPSALEPEYGSFIWLGNSRGYYKKAKGERAHDFVAKDLSFLDGRGKQRVYVIPSSDLVIVRVGERPANQWDDSVLPNLLTGM